MDHSLSAETAGPAAGYLGIKTISEWAGGGAPAPPDSGDAGWEETNDMLEFDHAHIGQPGITHFGALSVRVERGQHTLVVGGTRTRRTALSATLLNRTELLLGGRVRSPRAHRGLVQVSQAFRPYVRAGSTLWDLLVFPHNKAQSQRRGVEERHLAELLRFLDFGFLLQRVDDDWARVVDWAKVLDRRERAALALCRLLYHAPPFALVDDEALAELLPAQVRQVFGAANMHHVTLVVLADADPFDDRALSLTPPASASSTLTASPAVPGSCPAYLTCIGEFSRALRLRAAHDAGWEFCTFGYGSAERAAFDVQAERRWVWAHDQHAEREFRSRLQRRTSTLSQCTTTERRWLATPECPLSPTADRSASQSRRQSSRVVSPTLTARSSISDMALAGASTMLDFGSIRSRLLMVDNSISGLTTGRQPSPPLVKVLEAEAVDPTHPAASDSDAKEPAAADEPKDSGCSSPVETLPAKPALEDTVQQPVNRYARSRNYRRSARPGMGFSPRTSPKPASAMSFIPPASSSSSVLSSAPSTPQLESQSGRSSSSSRLSSQRVIAGASSSDVPKTATAAAPAAAAESHDGTAEPSAVSQPRRYQKPQPAAVTAGPGQSRIPPPPAAVHSRSSSRELSSGSSVASVPMQARPQHATASPIDELTAALRNL
ncbi:ATP-binding cassette long-chain fatty acid transporter pxa2 [Coemansia sp. RSA 2704]|nr:ATP-binding cassette long-chain fatty acid transporter pxa2 [Coemansia sp. RSA 2704]